LCKCNNPAALLKVKSVHTRIVREKEREKESERERERAIDR
jgi:hypothetical protein